ncbi:MAG: hypothetical protein QME54_04135 [Actinomycetota bacterium]|nr:hypothetical protein [Actinomycetota bacterium]
MTRLKSVEDLQALREVLICRREAKKHRVKVCAGAGCRAWVQVV